MVFELCLFLLGLIYIVPNASFLFTIIYSFFGLIAIIVDNVIIEYREEVVSLTKQFEILLKKIINKYQSQSDIEITIEKLKELSSNPEEF